MAISNSASGFRPGVCTSTTRPTSPFNGQVIYETDTKQTLVWQGSAWVMLTDADTPPGLQLIKSQTIGSSVSSVTVSDVFSSEFDNYQVTVAGGAMNSGDYGLNMYLGSTRSGYYYVGEYRNFGNTVNNVINATDAAEWGAVGIATTNSLQANVFLTGPNLAKITYFNDIYTYGNANGGMASMSGFLNNNTQYTSFTLFVGASSFTGGTIRVYGYRN